MEGQASFVQVQRLADRPRPVLQAHQLLDMPAAALGVDQVVHADAGDLHHADAGQPRAGLGQHDAAHRLAQLLQQIGGGVVDVDGGQDDGAALELFADVGTVLRGFGAQREEPALEGLDGAALLQLRRARGQGHLGRVLQIERQLRGGLVAALGLDLQAAQDHFLQPGRAVGAQRARRHRVDVEPPAQAAHAVGLAERPLAGGEVVEHHAQREQVAARVVAHELHLLGRHVRPGAHRQREFLVQQVGQVVVARQAEIDQHGGAVGAEQDVAGLDVQVHQVLAVQVVQRGGHARADLDHFIECQRGFFELGQQRRARDALHHDVGLAGEVALGDVLRHVAAGEHRQDHLLDLEADDGGRVFAALDARHLHDQLQAAVALVVHLLHLPEVGHAAHMQFFQQLEAVDHHARRQQAGRVVATRAVVAQRLAVEPGVHPVQ